MLEQDEAEKVGDWISARKYVKCLTTGELHELDKTENAEVLQTPYGFSVIMKSVNGAAVKVSEVGRVGVIFPEDPTREELRDYKLKDLNKPAIEKAMNEVLEELSKVKKKYPLDFNSLHEGYAVAKEEVDELWDEIKKKNPDKNKIRTEAMQAAAMFIRIMSELG